jgi:hypothetical protein
VSDAAEVPASRGIGCIAAPMICLRDGPDDIPRDSRIDVAAATADRRDARRAGIGRAASRNSCGAKARHAGAVRDPRGADRIRTNFTASSTSTC